MASRWREKGGKEKDPVGEREGGGRGKKGSRPGCESPICSASWRYLALMRRGGKKKKKNFRGGGGGGKATAAQLAGEYFLPCLDPSSLRLRPSADQKGEGGRGKRKGDLNNGAVAFFLFLLAVVNREVSEG